MTDYYKTQTRTAYELCEQNSNKGDPPALEDVLGLVHPGEWAADRMFLTFTFSGQRDTTQSIYLQFPDQRIEESNITAALDQFAIRSRPDQTVEWYDSVDEVTDAAILTTSVSQHGAEVVQTDNKLRARGGSKGIYNVIEEANRPILVQLQFLSVESFLEHKSRKFKSRVEQFEEAGPLGDLTLDMWHGNYRQYDEIDPTEYRNGYVITMRVLAGRCHHHSEATSTTPKSVAEQFSHPLTGDTKITAQHKLPKKVVPAVRNYDPPKSLNIGKLAALSLPLVSVQKPYVVATDDELRSILGEGFTDR